MDWQVDNIPMEPDEDNGDFEVIPTGAYHAKLVGFKVTDKPDWKIQRDLLSKPDQEPDRSQWEWSFEITDGEFKGRTIPNWTNRSWHTRSNAAGYACALLDVSMLPKGAGFTTQKLVGLPCLLFIEAKENTRGEERSYIRDVKAIPKRKAKPAMAPSSVVDEATDEEYWNRIAEEDALSGSSTLSD